MSKKKDHFERVLTNAFSINSFVLFIKEFLSDIQVIAPERQIKESSNFQFYIAGHCHIANYIGSDGKKVAVFTVELNKKETVERARSMQRNFVKKLLISGNIDGAIVAFYTKDENKWRLSFVRMDYEFAKGKVTENITPAKRYSYLVGVGEPCHTAKKRLFPIFKEDNINPSVDEIEEAFSVEKVTDEFFEQYLNKYNDLRDLLERSEDFMIEANLHNFTSEQFAKKLMGQIVFMYFIQKKGWLGVNALPRALTEKQYKDAYYCRGTKSREIIPIVYKKNIEKGDFYILNSEGLHSLNDIDETILASCVKGDSWGTGPKDFMRQLFKSCEKKGKNYFNDYLEPLFYNALNKNRGDNAYFPPLHSRIPFLNGGLFEQIDNYEWEHSNFNLDNSIFSEKTRNEWDANGILDIFDRYNFTMNEDEPMEKEVAIDPEMLGKIFENLLEIKDRKSKGAFYTPREIVHYMCQESITNYIVNKTGLPQDDVKDFIIYGEFMKDDDTDKDVREKNGGMLISSNIFDIKMGINRLKEIDDALANIRVLDPAVGSGAFPLGIINEIIKVRQTISSYYGISMNEYQKKIMYVLDRHPYALKTHTIKNCIFAVDIEPSAVDITKLRLWLSIVIDDEISPNASSYDEFLGGHKIPSPLPNLECNIRCGNSLIDELNGIELINISDLIGNTNNKSESNLYRNQFEILLNQLIQDQEKLFFIKDHTEKEDLKQHIQSVIDQIIHAQLSGASDETRKMYEDHKHDASLPYILWHLEFAKIFKEKGGFDIVIGNPPYIDSENMVNSGLEEERNIISKKYLFTKGNWDIYIAFFEKAYTLLNSQGTLIYITPDKWISKSFGDAMRCALISNFHSILVAGRAVFKSALVDSIITLISKVKTESIDVYSMKDNKSLIKKERTVNKSVLTIPYPLDIIFSNSLALIEKIEKTPERLLNYYFCENACATSDAYKLKEILNSFENSEEFDAMQHLKIINTGTIGRFESRWGVQPMTYLKDKYLYPFVFKEEFNELFPNSYSKKSEKAKVIIKGLTLLDCSIDSEGIIIPGKSTMMIHCEGVNELKFLSAFINCKLTIYYIKQRYSSSSYNGGINFTKDMINNLPWVSPSNDKKMEIINMVDKIIGIKHENNLADTKEIEVMIDEIFYSLFNLNEEDKSYIRNS